MFCFSFGRVRNHKVEYTETTAVYSTSQAPRTVTTLRTECSFFPQTLEVFNKQESKTSASNATVSDE